MESQGEADLLEKRRAVLVQNIDKLDGDYARKKAALGKMDGLARQRVRGMLQEIQKNKKMYEKELRAVEDQLAKEQDAGAQPKQQEREPADEPQQDQAEGESIAQESAAKLEERRAALAQKIGSLDNELAKQKAQLGKVDGAAKQKVHGRLMALIKQKKLYEKQLQPIEDQLANEQHREVARKRQQHDAEREERKLRQVMSEMVEPEAVHEVAEVEEKNEKREARQAKESERNTAAAEVRRLEEERTQRRAAKKERVRREQEQAGQGVFEALTSCFAEIRHDLQSSRGEASALGHALLNLETPLVVFQALNKDAKLDPGVEDLLRVVLALVREAESEIRAGAQPHGTAPEVKRVRNLAARLSAVVGLLHFDINAIVPLPDDAMEPVEIPESELELGDVIGSGSFGNVVRATWKGRTVAVKLVSAGNQALVTALRQEVAVCLRINHPNIIQVFGARTEKEPYCMVMEYAPHGNVANLVLSDTPLPLSTRVAMLVDVARGMQYLHHQRVLHRDLKGQNLLVFDNHRVKICDFGLARIKSSSQSLRTKGGAGTVAWMAPEVIGEQPHTTKADVYSFGGAMFELIARSLPFEGLKDPQILNAVIIQDKRPVLPKDCECPVELRDLMQQCWAKDPHARPDFDHIVERLVALQQSGSVGTDGRNLKHTNPTLLQQRVATSLPVADNFHTHVFLSHDWGQGEANHRRVAQVNLGLQKRGLVTWFDEEKMQGDIFRRMSGGIDGAQLFVAFVTTAYIAKVDKEDSDNCKFEFQYATNRRGPAKMLVVVTDASARNPKEWTGPVGMVLGSHLYVDMGDGDSPHATKIDELFGLVCSNLGLDNGASSTPGHVPSGVKREAGAVNAGPVEGSGSHEVTEFLVQAGIDNDSATQCAGVLAANGWDSVESLELLEKDDLDKVGIKLLHFKLIQRALQRASGK